jgi:hypothetical protein
MAPYLYTDLRLAVGKDPIAVDVLPKLMDSHGSNSHLARQPGRYWAIEADRNTWDTSEELQNSMSRITI